MLPSERDTNDGDTKQQAEDEMRQADPKTTDEDPDNIHQQAEASARAAAVCHCLSERPQRQDS